MKLFVKNLLFTLLIPGTVAIYLPIWISHSRHISPISLRVTLGILLLVSGIVIYLWTVWDFAVAGKGTPMPIDAPRKLVVRGLYRYIRNPMYLGVVMVILSWACIFADLWLVAYAMGVSLLIHLFVVFYEEPKLRQLFGEEYENYNKSVGRWIPNIIISSGPKKNGSSHDIPA